MAGALRLLAGLVLAGYGLLVVAGVLPHDALAAGVVALVLGAVLLASTVRAGRLPPVRVERAAVVGGLGLAAVVGVLAYNAGTGSSLSWPEIGLLAYGLALVAAAWHLDARLGRVPVATMVGWSFPLLLAPFGIFALNALLADSTPAPASPLIELLLVQPLAACLGLLGDPARVLGTNVLLPTPRGTLTLGVGLVCAGLYPMVLFLGVLGLHGWQQRLPARRFALYLGLGLLGLWLANLLRLVVLAKVGQAWGGAALQEAHAHAGWVLFVGFMLLFWGVVMHRIERSAEPA